ncbi:transmembrane protein 26, partial [Branchiostoma belcheri]
MSRKSTGSRDGNEMGDRNANISMANISVHPQSASSVRSKRAQPAPPPRARPSLRGRPSPSRSVHCPEGWHTFRMAAGDFFEKMLDVINTSFNIFKAILTRLLFSLHAIITIWRTEENTGQPLFWLFCLPLYFLLVEGVITIKKRKGLEWKWFCPSVLFYLMSVIPSLWVLEFDIMYKRFKSPDECPKFFPQTTPDGNSTEVSTTTVQTTVFTATVTPNTTAGSDGPHSLFEVFPLDDSAWVLALHQTMLCILILGRWMLPKPGDVSRDQLSQLLLVYFGIAADILEFQLESVKEEAVKCNEVLIVVVMVFWTWSLIQFTLVLTATKTGQVVEDNKLDRINLHGCCESEVWSILVAMLMQDFPFLVVRLFLMIQYNSVHQMMIFFTAKNILVLMLQTYRWYVLMAERRAEREQLEDQGRRHKEGKSARPWEPDG